MKKRWTPFVLLVAAAACGPPVIYDTHGRAVSEPEYMAAVDGGWLAVDSSAAGIRAVLELKVAAPEGRAVTWEPAGLQLWTGKSYPVLPTRLKQGALRCWPTTGRAPCRGNAAELDGCPVDVRREQQDCYYTLCAEFPLAELPTPTDPVVLNVGGSLTILHLAEMK